MSEYWFARRFPRGNPRNALAPITREGWYVSIGFVSAMVFGALVFTVLTFNGAFTAGIVLFIVIALAAGVGFVWIASQKADLEHTLDDYKKMRSGQGS